MLQAEYKSASAPASAETAKIQHYTLKHKAIAWVSSTLFDWPVYTVRRGLLAGMRRKGGMAWLPITQPETKESLYWAQKNFTGKVVYDIGAFHGLLTLYFAKSATSVVSFEPDEINRRSADAEHLIERPEKRNRPPGWIGGYSRPGEHAA